MFEHEEIGRNTNPTNEVIELDLEDNQQPTNTAQMEQDIQKNQAKKFINISFWQTYFDINQYEMKDRLLVLTNPNNLLIAGFIEDKQELYGPFWIATSLIFCLFAFGNLSALYAGQGYSYDLVGMAASCVYGFFNKLFAYCSDCAVLFVEIFEFFSWIRQSGLISYSICLAMR